MKYLQPLKTSLFAMVVSASPLAADAPQSLPHDGTYKLMRIEETESSGTLTIKQYNMLSVAVENIKFTGGHYQARLKSEVFSTNKSEAELGGGTVFQRLHASLDDAQNERKSLNSLRLEKRTRLLSQFILYQLQNSYLKLNLMPNSPQGVIAYGAKVTYNTGVRGDEHIDEKENFDIVFCVTNMRTRCNPLYELIVADPAEFHSAFAKEGYAAAAPVARFLLIKEEEAPKDPYDLYYFFHPKSEN